MNETLKEKAKSILLIEDRPEWEPLFLDVLPEDLVDVARNMSDARRMFLANQGDYKIVICDAKLPVGNGSQEMRAFGGFELLKEFIQARGDSKTPHFFIVTATFETYIVEKAREIRVDLFFKHQLQDLGRKVSASLSKYSGS